MAKIRFYKIYDSQPARRFIAGRLRKLAAGKKLLLMLSGGSAIGLEVDIVKELLADGLDLTATLIDERYGKVGHPASNWTQLQAAGLPKLKNYQILSGQDFDTTVADFNKFLAESFTEFDCLAGILGMGADGHTSGILPGSPAVGAKDLVVGYQGPDYLRVTTTPEFLKHLSPIFLYALGENKWPQLDRLADEISVSEQPVQALKSAAELIVFSDHLGEEP